MANELKHGSVGTELTQAEWEGVGTHVFNSQATGDIVYASSATQLSRLAISGTATHILSISGGVPAWAAPAAAAAGSLTGSTLASGVTASSLTSVGTIATGTWQGTDVGVAYGGTGVSTLTDNAVLTGTGASAITAESNLTFDGSTLTVNAAAIFNDSGVDVDFRIESADNANMLVIDGALNNMAIGSAVDADVALMVNLPTFVPSTGQNGTWAYLSPRLTEAGSGTHANMVGVHIAPLANTNAGGATTNAATFRIGGAPTGATPTAGNFAMWVQGGTSRFDGDVDLNDNDLLNVGASGNDWTANSLSVNNSNADAAVNMYVRNTSTSASGSSAHLTLWTAATSGTGDPYVSWTRTGGGTWNAGMDVSDSDAFVISNGTLGAANAIRIDTSENVYFGADGTNQDVYFYGDTSPKDMTWDAGANALILKDDAAIRFGTGSDSIIKFDGSDTYWDLQAAGTGGLTIALGDLPPAPDNDAVHIWGGTAGSVTADANSLFVIEGSDTGEVGMSILSVDASRAQIRFTSPTAGSTGGIQYFHKDDSPADTLQLVVANGVEYKFSATDLSLENNTLSNVGASGNDWTANNLSVATTNAGGDNMIKVENSSTAANSNSILYLTAEGSDGTSDAFVRFNRQTGTDVNWRLGYDNSNSVAFVLSNSNALGTNDALRVTNATPPVTTYNTTHPTGTFSDYACDDCGKSSNEMFDCCGIVRWRDDVMDFRAMALRDPDALDYMERVGVIERTTDNDGNPEIFTVLGRDFEFAMSAAFQNRERMDAQNEAMDARLKRIEQALGV